MKLNNLIHKRRVVYFCLALFFISLVFTTIQASTMGAKLQFLEGKEAQLANESLKLEQELSEKDSLSKISQEAENLKFVKPQRIVYPQETKEIVFSLR